MNRNFTFIRIFFMGHNVVYAICPVTQPKRLYLKIKQGLTDTLQLLAYSFIFLHLSFVPAAHAGPTGGAVVGGAGNINQAGLNTTINQTTQNMAIDWQSFNVNVDERVQYIQPNANSISLNRILSHVERLPVNGHVL